MPVITVDGPKLSKEQKTELVKSITKAASEIIKLPEQAFIVLIQEREMDNVGVGGVLLSDKKTS
ncbi:4-oxalocrotonate tautomerase DmpI [Desulfallas thermosapovorans]|uniref:4-oxalocrotonate tautomerase n=1 Tax=Desulfallas thermosapovorans DSM 6562 TaxID=1121431 RepID=A0A5S4ZSK6_9FIRM|nr:4-oxalocrotonate tautomerase DmpI [Desulfallas thermosapovorans]TYO95051.1 4-oxalocrotonate tautomerase [Desulfallas thermosapovorans DSM 6562]